jgi:hypothetical protein
VSVRIRLLVAAVAGMFWGMAASADVTARYGISPDIVPNIIVQANDRGDSRISFGNGMAVITTGGISYVLMGDLLGIFAIKQADMLALAEESARAMTPPATLGPRGDLIEAFNYTARRDGEETVAGRTGARWVVGLPGGEGMQPLDHSFVISRDPDLGPIGRALARQYRPANGSLYMSTGAGGQFGAVPSRLLDEIRRGTVLRMGQMLYLHDVERGPVPASAFELPAAVLSREAFAARMGWPPRRAE